MLEKIKIKYTASPLVLKEQLKVWEICFFDVSDEKIDSNYVRRKKPLVSLA